MIDKLFKKDDVVRIAVSVADGGWKYNYVDGIVTADQSEKSEYLCVGYEYAGTFYEVVKHEDNVTLLQRKSNTEKIFVPQSSSVGDAIWHLEKAVTILMKEKDYKKAHFVVETLETLKSMGE